MTVATPTRAALGTAQAVTHTGAGASFAAVGSPLAHAAQVVILSSTLNDGMGAGVSAWVSIDGTNNQILMPGNSLITLDVSANKQGSGRLAFPKGTQFYLKQGPDGAPSAGDFSVSIVYAR